MIKAENSSRETYEKNQQQIQTGSTETKERFITLRVTEETWIKIQKRIKQYDDNRSAWLRDLIMNDVVQVS